MVSKTPPLEMMSPETREQFAETQTVIEEPIRDESDVASSVDDLFPSGGGRIRYRLESICGLAKKVRFKSLTAAQFLAVSDEEDNNILLYSVCDESGNCYLTANDIKRLQSDENDARTLMHMIAVANDHCLAGASLEGLTEAAAKNSPKIDTTSSG